MKSKTNDGAELVLTTDESNESLRKATRKDLYMIDPRAISVDESFNIREDYGDIEELAESILQNGVKTPLRGSKVGENEYKLTDGFRRMRAIKLLLEKDPDAVKAVQFILEPKTYTDEQRFFDMFITNSGKNLTPLEEGKLFQRLLDLGYKRNEISSRIGKTEAHISNMLGLNTVPKTVKNLINNGTIKATEVNKLRRQTSSNEELESVINQSVEEAQKIGKTTVTEKAIRKVTKTVKKDATFVELEELKSSLQNDGSQTNVKYQTLDMLIRYLGSENHITLDELTDFFKS
jgi:ParB family chromosome partitioning protein